MIMIMLVMMNRKPRKQTMEALFVKYENSICSPDNDVDNLRANKPFHWHKK